MFDSEMGVCPALFGFSFGSLVPFDFQFTLPLFWQVYLSTPLLPLSSCGSQWESSEMLAKIQHPNRNLLGREQASNPVKGGAPLRRIQASSPCLQWMTKGLFDLANLENLSSAEFSTVSLFTAIFVSLFAYSLWVLTNFPPTFMYNAFPPCFPLRTFSYQSTCLQEFLDSVWGSFETHCLLCYSWQGRICSSNRLHSRLCRS